MAPLRLPAASALTWVTFRRIPGELFSGPLQHFIAHGVLIPKSCLASPAAFPTRLIFRGGCFSPLPTPCSWRGGPSLTETHHHKAAPQASQGVCGVFRALVYRLHYPQGHWRLERLDTYDSSPRLPEVRRNTKKG